MSTNLRVVPLVRPTPPPTPSPAVMPQMRSWEGPHVTPRQRAAQMVVVAEHGLVVIAAEGRSGQRIIARKVPALVCGISEEVLAIDMLIEQLAQVAPAEDEVIDLFAVNPGLRGKLKPACTSGQLVGHEGIPASMHDLHRRAMEEVAQHPLQVATDASRSRRHRQTGLAAVAETGKWVTKLTSATNINSAEIAAISLCSGLWAPDHYTSDRTPVWR